MIPSHGPPPLPRLFLAVDLPSSARFSLLSLPTFRIPNAHIVSDESYHITLHFLGDTAPEPVARVARRVSMPNFNVSLTSVGAFPHNDKPYTIFARPHSEGLLQLQQQLATVLAADGFQIDTRPYQPHVTLAKLRPKQKASLNSARIFLDENTNFRTNSFCVNEFVLMESVRGSRGRSRYIVRDRFPLQEQTNTRTDTPYS